MKKIFNILLSLLLVITLVGCLETNNPSPEPNPGVDPDLLNDKIAPLLEINDTTKRTVTFKQNQQNINLTEGLRALDNKEGDISDRIEFMLNGFDIAVPGEYEVIFFVEDLAGNTSNFVSKIITVEKVYQVLTAYPIYTGTIKNEASKPDAPRVFQGAYYYKVVSSKDYWVGIEAEMTLPMPDINRYQTAYNESIPVDPNAKNLDNPSIYMGGNVTHESDIGLSLKNALVKQSGGTSIVSVGSFAFRPFWRYITSYDYDEGTYDRANGRYYSVSATGTGTTKNMSGNWDFNATEFYYLPGDRIRMIVYSPKPGYLQLQIEVIEKSSLPYSVEVRRTNGWADPENFISPVFASPGHGSSKAEFKRVNAIDQVANEGKPTTQTTTVIGETIYHNAYLHRNIDGTLYRVPMNNSRIAITGAPNINDFTVSSIDPLTGGQTVKIYPLHAQNIVALIPTQSTFAVKKEEI